MRAHFNRPLQDEMGNQVDEAVVRVLTPGTTDPIAAILYVDDTSGLTLTNPWSITDGEIDFYLDDPQRVLLGITVTGSPEEFWVADVLAAATDSSHPGMGADSVQVGVSADAPGTSATAVGVGASAEAPQTTAVGHQASAVLDQAVALGEQASAAQPGAVALGAAAVAGGSQSIAVGNAAQAPWNYSTAVGAGSLASQERQVMLGTPDDHVDVPGVAVLYSPDGSRFQLRVADDGQLFTQKLAVWVQPPPVEEGEGDVNP